MLNLTQHNATEEQKEAGVVEPLATDKVAIRDLLTFDEPPSREEMETRAAQIAKITERYKVNVVMIGGAPFFMSILERTLRGVGVTPFYAFSKREVVEEVLDDGTVKKIAIFKHVGFVEAA